MRSLQMRVDSPEILDLFCRDQKCKANKSAFFEPLRSSLHVRAYNDCMYWLLTDPNVATFLIELS